MKLKVKEKDVLKACIEYLALKGFKCIRNNTGAFVGQYTNKKGKTKTRFHRYGQRGSSDIIACSPKGMFYAIECKSDTGEPSDKQLEFLQSIKDRNGYAIVARSVDDLINAGI